MFSIVWLLVVVFIVVLLISTILTLIQANKTRKFRIAYQDYNVWYKTMAPLLWDPYVLPVLNIDLKLPLHEKCFYYQEGVKITSNLNIKNSHKFAGKLFTFKIYLSSNYLSIFKKTLIVKKYEYDLYMTNRRLILVNWQLKERIIFLWKDVIELGPCLINAQEGYTFGTHIMVRNHHVIIVNRNLNAALIAYKTYLKYRKAK